MKPSVKHISLCGIFTAIIFVFTAYLHIPSHNGYIHVGDAAIFLAACLLPTPYALFAAAVGASLADLLSGFALWAPATAIIKGLTVLCFARRDRIINPRNLLALIPSALLCIGGYYLYESLLTQNFLVAIPGMLGSLMQILLSGALFAVLGLALDNINLRRNLR